MGVILYAFRKLKSCMLQVENMHPSGASEQDIVSTNSMHIYIYIKMFMYILFSFPIYICLYTCIYKHYTGQINFADGQSKKVIGVRSKA